MIPAPAATRSTPARRMCTASARPWRIRSCMSRRAASASIARDVGGGFGMKGQTYPEEAVLVWAARRVGRPVKWIPSRAEALLGDNQGRDQKVDAELALDADGRFLALRWTGMHNAGAYIEGARRDPDRVFAEARLDRLRHPGGRGDEQPRLHQHRADHALSRRRPPRGRLHHGAPRRPGGARDAYRPGRIAPEEPDPARRLPLPDAHRLDLRYRPLCRGDGEVPGPGRLGRLCRAARGERGRRQMPRPQHRLLRRQHRHLQRAHGIALRPRVAN